MAQSDYEKLRKYLGARSAISKWVDIAEKDGGIEVVLASTDGVGGASVVVRSDDEGGAYEKGVRVIEDHFGK